MSTEHSEYFVDGGTLDPEAPSYVTRGADSELYARVSASEYCYVLTCRQMGKSSLMVRTERRLRAAGVATAIVDLTAIGTHELDSDALYLGVLSKVRRDLRLRSDLAAWWQEHAAIGAPQRFAAFLREVVLAERSEPVVIFIDEIDSTLKLAVRFRDDFFAAIRALYNRRASDPEFNRLTFVLIGAATPNDLITSTERTPFNIGQRIALGEFTADEAVALRAGLEAHHPGQGEALLAHVLGWTNGHPYLTQRLCKLIAERDGPWDTGQVDALVAETFFSDQGRKDANLTPIQFRVADLPADLRRRLLRLYRRIYDGRPVRDDRQSVAQSYLELFGLARAEAGGLRVRNRIYRHIFDQQWIAANTPADRQRLTAWAVVFLAVVIVAAVIITALNRTSNGDQAAIFVQQYRESRDNAVRLSALASLFALIPGDDSYNQDALRLFYDETADPAQLFVLSKPQTVGAALVTVSEQLISTLDPEQMPGWEALADNITMALQHSGQGAAATRLIETLDTWRRARGSLADNKLTDAMQSYQDALGLMPDQPVLRYELALAYRHHGDIDLALGELEGLLDQVAHAKPTPTPDRVTATITPSLPPASASARASNGNPVSVATSTPSATPTSSGASQLVSYDELRFANGDRIKATVRAALGAYRDLAGRIGAASYPQLAALAPPAPPATSTPARTRRTPTPTRTPTAIGTPTTDTVTPQPTPTFFGAPSAYPAPETPTGVLIMSSAADTAVVPSTPPTPIPSVRALALRVVLLSYNDASTCISMQIRGTSAIGWRLRVDGLNLVGTFAGGNARVCGLGVGQEVTVTVLNQNGSSVAGGAGIPAKGSAILTGTWR